MMLSRRWPAHRRWVNCRRLASQAGVAESKRGKRLNWQEREVRERFLDSVRERYSVVEAEDWKKVDVRGVRRMPGGKPFMSYYDDSFLAALRDLEPGLELPAAAFMKSVPSSHWSSHENRRRFLDFLAKRHGVEKAEDWAKVTTQDVASAGGAGLVKNRSLLAVLQEAYPEVEPHRFENRKKPRGHWDGWERRRAFMDRIAEELDVHTAEDWRGVQRSEIEKRGGKGLLTRFNYSFLRLLQDAYPEKDMSSDSCRPKATRGFWKDVSKEELRQLVDRVAGRLGVEQPSDWADVTAETLKHVRGGHSLLKRCNGSIYSLIKDVYGEDGEFEIYKCRPSVPTEFWQEASNLRSFFEHTRELLHIDNKEEWARVTWKQLREVPGGSSFLNSKLGMKAALEMAYPGETWNAAAFEGTNKRATQREVRVFVEQLFPLTKVLEDYRDHGALTSARGKALELDIYLPELEMALEYNGEQHYQELPFFGPLELTQLRDKEKRELCEAHGIRLVTVPYWWDRTLESLAATIYTQFPAAMQKYISTASE